MTDVDPKDALTVATDGVTVEKSFEPDDFPVPAIAFEIRSEREESVSIRLVDTVPEDVTPENIGFHPKYGAEFWGVENGHIVFERTLSPGEEYTTVYGLRGGDSDIAEKFMSEPTLESVDPPLIETDEEIDTVLDAAAIDPVGSGEETSDTSPEEPVPSDQSTDSADPLSVNGSGSDVDSAESDSETEPSDPSTSEGSFTPESDEADATTTDADESSTPAERTGTDAETAPSADADSDTGQPSDQSESVVATLAAELRADDVNEDDLLELRDALGLDMGTASVEARIEHLQSEVADLSAYTEALEEFLDEEGNAQTLLAEVRDDYEETVDRIEELETELGDIQSDIESRFDTIDERIAAVEDRVEAAEDRLDSDLEGLDDELADLDDRIDAESEAREDIESELSDLSAELADVAEMRDRLANALGGLAGGPSAGETDIDDTNDSMTTKEDDEGTSSEESDADPS